MNLADIKQLFTYTVWANDLATQAASKLPDDDLHRDVGISHKSIFGTLLHMAAAEWIWLERWHGRSPKKEEAWPQWSSELIPNVATLNERWSAVVDRRWELMSNLDESKLTIELPFRLLNGDASSMQLGHQMQHVVNHATLHRGQVVGMIRQLGIEPPATDLLFYLREKNSPQ